jgi:hypothetical protein
MLGAMAMGILRYRFAPEVDERAWRALLREEIGRRANAWNVTTAWHAPEVLEVLSQDAIALTYARKVSRALMGEPVAPTTERPLPAWAETRWVELGAWARFRLWLRSSEA